MLKNMPSKATKKAAAALIAQQLLILNGLNFEEPSPEAEADKAVRAAMKKVARHFKLT